ncbi:MAG TPA: hypothetical protein VGF74_17370 [Thermoleophilaceae bacterium]|jgi:hypothetical protein
MLKKLLITLATSSLLIGAVAAAPAHASRNQQSIFEDDTALLFSGDGQRQQSLDEMKSLGANSIRTLVQWSRIAPDTNASKKPAGFDATNPDAYPPGVFAPWDSLVQEAQSRGLKVIMSPVLAPTWADTCKGNSHRCKPSPKEFGQFITALGKRYPTVHSWSIWNEPNISAWLYPQQQRVHGHNIPTAAIVYRNLFNAATTALKAEPAHAHDQFLLGETAPLGRTSGSLGKRFLSPTSFYQGVFCLDSRGHKLRGRIAKDEGCTHYKKLAATGIAHHPYNRGGSQPPLRKPTGPGEITIANLSQLSRVINQGSHNHRIRGGLKFFFTEFGFQSNPPDRTFGVSLARQARYINQSDYIAYHNSRVSSVAQYELFDDSDPDSFNTGLRRTSGKAKPALNAYRLPIWVIKTHSGVSVWGQVRPAGGTPQTVQIQNGNKKFKTVKTVRTAGSGYFTARIGRKAGAKWKLLWKAPDGTTFASRVAGIGT